MVSADPAFDVPPGAVTGLPDDVVSALSCPPLWDKRLLELRLRWPDGADAAATALADSLRVFLLTWDPFEWSAERPPAFATAARRPDGYGLVLYLPYWQAVALGQSDDGGIAGVLGRLGQSVLTVAAEHQDLLAAGEYPAAVHAGTARGLLSRIPEPPTPTAATVELVGAAWQDLQFDALEDLAQDAFGPAELERAPVTFTEAGDNKAGCPGCAGGPLSFPDGLKDAQATICPTHRAEALKVITARLEQAQASNPAGWEGLLEAGRRLDEPHLPLGLGPRLVAAAALEDPTPAQLSEQADLVVETARLTSGRIDAMRALAGRADDVRRWLDALPARVAAQGMDEQSEAAATAAIALMAGGPEASAPAPDQAPPKPLGPPKPEPIRRGPRIGRNAACPCGSGRKYKFCHGQS